jgi:hypothetical protein
VLLLLLLLAMMSLMFVKKGGRGISVPVVPGTHYERFHQFWKFGGEGQVIGSGKPIILISSTTSTLKDCDIALQIHARAWCLRVEIFTSILISEKILSAVYAHTKSMFSQGQHLFNTVTFKDTHSLPIPNLHAS